jgi:glycosyltransferase involved in cell wall biosynthesis
MASGSLVSIILSTRNRGPSLQETLRTLGRIKVLPGWRAEVVLVDNASTDDTAKIARNVKLPSMEVVYVHEPNPGKSNALNTGLARAKGDILLFTDDDVSVPEDWLDRMVAPLVEGRCDLVVGQIKLAENLCRPWISGGYKGFLAQFDFESGPLEMVGANAGFRRGVLDRVRGFDSELGPGALGLGEDTLFGWQLVEAGFRMELARNATVVHQPDPSRLLRRSWLGSARSLGRSRAYLHYHWEHEDIQAPFVKWMWMATKLRLRRLLQQPQSLDSEGCPPWELSYTWHTEMYRQFCLERRRPRNYARRGLTKLTH